MSVGLALGFRVVGANDGIEVGVVDGTDDIGTEESSDVVGMIVGSDVGLAVGVSDGVEVGVVDGTDVGTEEGFDEGIIVGVNVGLAVTVEEDGIAVVEGPAEHPAVFFTSATTALLHAPPESCAATQKKAPPLHEYCPLLYVRRSDMIFTAWAALVFEPVPLQSEIHIPNTTLWGCMLNISFARDENKTPALIAPAPDPPMPSM